MNPTPAKKHPVLSRPAAVLAVFVPLFFAESLASSFVTGLLYNPLFPLTGLAPGSFAGSCFYGVLRLAGVALACGLLLHLLRTRCFAPGFRFGVLRRDGLWAGLRMGAAPCLLFTLFELVPVRRYGFAPQEPLAWLECVLSGLRPGLEEELLLRGVLMVALLAAFRPSGQGPLWAALASSALFGAMHLLNLASGEQPLPGVLIQVVYATALGLLFSAIYLRTHSLAAPIFYHALIDIASHIAYNPDPATRLVPAGVGTTLAAAALTTGLALALLRPEKQPEVEALWANLALA